jgi:glycosyltransferase involved in cell wall biosynthesis
MKITVLKAANGGVAFYRALQPYTYLQKDKDLDIFIYDTEIHHPHMLWKWMDMSDVLIYQMPWGKAVAEVIRENKLRANPKKIIVEFDDNIFNLSPYNRAYSRFGTEEVQNAFLDKESIAAMKKQGQKPSKIGPNMLDQLKKQGVNPKDAFVVDLWKDGEREFNLKQNQIDAEDTRYTVANADVVTVTTMELGRQLRKYRPTGEIAVMGNLVDTTRWLPMKENDTDEIRIGWQGGDAHFLDLLQVAPALDKLFDKHKNLKFVTMGGHFPSLFTGPQYKDKYEHIYWHPDIYTYPLAVRDMKCDIMIAPLINDKFNMCKSELKWLEYAMLRVPGVYSNIVYANEVKHAKTGFIANDKDEWFKYLDLLVTNKELRKEIADKAYNRVSEYHNLDQAELYKQMLYKLKMKELIAA